MQLSADHIGGLHGKGEGLVGHEGGHVSNFQLFPALGHHQQHLDIAAALRGQGGGVREALGVLVVQRDGGGALDGLEATKSVVSAASAWKFASTLLAGGTG